MTMTDDPYSKIPKIPIIHFPLCYHRVETVVVLPVIHPIFFFILFLYKETHTHKHVNIIDRKYNNLSVDKDINYEYKKLWKKLKLLNLSPSLPALESAGVNQPTRSQIWKSGRVSRSQKISEHWSPTFVPSSNENIQDGIMSAKNSRTALSGIGAPPSNTHRARVFRRTGRATGRISLFAAIGVVWKLKAAGGPSKPRRCAIENIYQSRGGRAPRLVEGAA